MSEVIFKPYVGKNYKSGGIFGKRILVLGESHYCSKEEACDTLTEEVLQEYLNHEVNEGWMNTFKKFVRALVGKTTSSEDSFQIWDSLAFYNYLQVPMADNRLAGTEEDYKNAEKPFFEVLDELKPDFMIIWGKRLWNKTPGTNWTLDTPVIVDNYENPVGTYMTPNGHKVITTPVYHHPSTSFDWDYCYRVLKKIGIVD